MTIFAEKKDRQNFFALTCIQISSIGIGPIAMGNLLSADYGLGVGFGSIIVGNLILWVMGIAIVSMSHQKNSIQIMKGYIGEFACYLICAIFIICALDWFAYGITSTVNSLQELIPVKNPLQKNVFLRIGTAIGVFSGLLALGGIRTLKWASFVAFPFLIIYVGCQLFTSDFSIPTIEWGLCFPAVMMVIFSRLGGTLNLPTFFRHSNSRSDSCLALSLCFLFYTFFECAAIWMSFKDASFGILMRSSMSSWLQNQSVILFIILTCVCNNLMNIYFAAAFYETFSPRFLDMKGRAIMGLMGTSIYAFLQISSPIAFVISLLNGYIINLSVVLVVSFLFRLIRKRNSSFFEKCVNSLAWIVGCMATTIAKFCQGAQEGFEYIYIGIGFSCLFYLVFIFIEETVIGIRALRLE